MPGAPCRGRLCVMTAEPASDADVWWSALRWIDAAHMQISRFEEAFYEDQQALADAEMRRGLSDDSDNSRTWRDSYDEHEPFDPQRPLRVPSWSLHMQIANELDLLIVAVRNVLRAQRRIPEGRRTEMGRQDVIELLRNVAEHWDEVGGRSANTLASDHPDISVGGIAFTGKEIWIGGDRGVPLSRITAWLWRVRSALVACLADVGIEVPEDFNASRFEGDDDLPWPSERLHFHWSIPRVEEPDWPREPIPEGALEAIAVLFANRRRRDPLD
jgi:hypothetical protein